MISWWNGEKEGRAKGGLTRGSTGILGTIGIYVPYLGCNGGFGIYLTTNLSKNKLEKQASYYILINQN